MIKDHASTWPFEDQAVVSAFIEVITISYNLEQIYEIFCYVIAISEDELHGNIGTAIHTATYDLLPEVGYLYHII